MFGLRALRNRFEEISDLFFGVKKMTAILSTYYFVSSMLLITDQFYCEQIYDNYLVCLSTKVSVYFSLLSVCLVYISSHVLIRLKMLYMFNIHVSSLHCEEMYEKEYRVYDIV